MRTERRTSESNTSVRATGSDRLGIERSEMTNRGSASRTVGKKTNSQSSPSYLTPKEVREGVRAQPSAAPQPREFAGLRPPVREKGGSVALSSMPHGDIVVDANSVLEMASKLSRSDRQEVLAQLALLSKMTDSKVVNRDLDMWADSLQRELSQTIGMDGGESYGLLLVKKYMGEPGAWRPVETFMEKARYLQRSTAERKAMYNLLARLLVEHSKTQANRLGTSLGLKFVAGCANAIAGIFDDAFPNYLASGLAWVVARQMQSIATGLTAP